MQKALILSLSLFATPLVFANKESPNTTKDCKTIPLTAPEFICSNPHPIFFANLDFIYWISKPGGVRTYNAYQPVSPTFSNTVTQDFFPNVKGKPGFKIGVGGYLTDVNWEMYAQYTWFYNNRGIPPLNNRTTDPDLYGYTTMGNSYANVFNRVDLVLRKRISSGEFISVNPFAGLLAGWDEQWWRNRVAFVSAPSITPGDGYVIDQKWWGIGPYMGFNGLLYLPVGFFCPAGQLGFYLDGGVALPLSQYQLTLVGNSFISQAEETNNTNPVNWIAKFRMISAMLESSIGLHWITLYGKDRVNTFSLKLGWEEQFWYNHAYFSDDDISTGPENYLMQGLTLRAQVEF